MATYNILTDSGLTEPLTSPASELAEMSEKISDNVDQLRDLVLLVEDYQEKLGSAHDTVFLRTKVKEKIGKGNGIIMQTIDFFQQFDSLSLKQLSSREANMKVSRKNQMTFEGYRERYTKALREVYKRERIYAPNKRAMHLPDHSVDLERLPDMMAWRKEEQEEVKLEFQERQTQSVKIQISNSSFEELDNEMSKSQGFKKKIVIKKAAEFRTWEEKAQDLERRVLASQRAKDLSQGEEELEEEHGKIDGKRNTIIGIVALMILIVLTLLLGSGRFQLISI